MRRFDGGLKADWATPLSSLVSGPPSITCLKADTIEILHQRPSYGLAPLSVAPELCKSTWCKRCIPRCRLQFPMPQVMRQRQRKASAIIRRMKRPQPSHYGSATLHGTTGAIRPSPLSGRTPIKASLIIWFLRKVSNTDREGQSRGRDTALLRH